MRVEFNGSRYPISLTRDETLKTYGSILNEGILVVSESDLLRHTLFETIDIRLETLLQCRQEENIAPLENQSKFGGWHAVPLLKSEGSITMSP